MSASSSSSDAPGPSSANAKIEKLEAKRDRVEAERELVKDLLKVKEGERDNFFDNNQGYEGLESFTTPELKEEKNRLDQAIHDLSAEIHVYLRPSSVSAPESPLLGSCVYVLVGEFPTPKGTTRAAQATPRGLFPLGTAFAVWTKEKQIAFTANHVLAEHSNATSWYITLSIGRNSDTYGTWLFNSEMIEVNVILQDNDLDLAILVRKTGVFEDRGMIHISPDVPSVADEWKFKTYYIAIQDIQEDHSGPPLTAAPTEAKKMYGITRGNGGKVWLRGGLCNGSSGGVVVNYKGHAMAMHLLSASPSKASSSIKKEDKLSGIKRTDEDRESESTNSIVNDHSSSQVCLLLSECNVVAQYIA